MSTQHTGDGPPGAKITTTHVEEEIIRATGSGRNPNAAAWDLEKMELPDSKPTPGSGGGLSQLGQWSMWFQTR